MNMQAPSDDSSPHIAALIQQKGDKRKGEC